jgi:hypothetical protein
LALITVVDEALSEERPNGLVTLRHWLVTTPLDGG